MSIFISFVDAVKTLPDWIALLACPALLAAAAVLLAVFKRKNLFHDIAVALGVAGFFLMCCEGDVRYAFAWAGLYTAEYSLVRLLFLLPSFKRKNKKSKEDRMYEKFKEELFSEQIPCAEQKRAKEKLPPKVCCFDELPSEGKIKAEESGLRLSHVTALLEKLRLQKLSAGDRLETDTIARTLDLYRNKSLTEEELRSLNDCLASVLKLTAKYQLS